MPDLIIHIGFPKCASTSLQKIVFNHERGYLGGHGQHYSRQFRSCTAVGPRQWSSFSQVRKWAESVKTEHGVDIKRFILSDEMLTNRNKFRNRPIIYFLKKFSNEIWTEGEVKVVLILRNYAERMASEYAQISDLNSEASQANFEDQILKMRMPDYAKWVLDLYEALGRNNVCVLLMEDIDQIKFWNQLYEFCEIEFSEPESMINNSRNTKRKGHNTWIIQPFDPVRKGKTIAFHIFDSAWPHHILSEFRSASFDFVRYKFERFYLRKYASVNEHREEEIHLDSDLRKMIQKRTSKSTEDLSSYLNRDMHALGY